MKCSKKTSDFEVGGTENGLIKSVDNGGERKVSECWTENM